MEEKAAFPLVAANWKMNNALEKTKAFFQEFTKLIEENPVDGVDILVCPPFTSLHEARIHTSPRIMIGAQNMHHEEKGAFTGEVSGSMLAEIGVSHVILGHSERRNLFSEKDEDVRKKALAALSHSITPIICVGESLDIRKDGNHISFVESQLEASVPSGEDLARIRGNDAGNGIIIAYEPLWAIGTGEAATPQQAEEMHNRIHSFLSVRLRNCCPPKVIYGGSVKPGNARDFMGMQHINGLLVGGASLEPSDFHSICMSSIPR